MTSDLLRDEELLSQLLRRKLLRSMIRATGVLRDSARGKQVSVAEARVAEVLLRLAPRIMLDPPKHNDVFDAPEWWTVEKLRLMEILGPYDSRESAAQTWRTCFDKNGPRAGLFQTRAEAAEYGRRRYDELKAKQDAGEEPSDE